MVLVTGASGMLGREVVRRTLKDGWAVRGTDLLAPDPKIDETYEHIRADLLDPKACSRLCDGVERIVHTAALQHHSHPPKFRREAFFQRNVVMTRNLAEAAEATGVRHVVFISSDMVYGIPRNRPILEASPRKPIGPYGRSKLASELVWMKKRDSGMKVTIFRPRLLVGPGRLGILTKLFNRIRSGKSILLIGNGKNRYQMVSVSDVAEAIMLAFQRQPDAILNLGSADVPSTQALVDYVARRAGSASRIVRTPKFLVEAALSVLHAFRMAPLVPEQFRIAGVDYILDITAAERELGWSPRLNDAEMLWQAYRQYVVGLPSDAT